jgi:anti-sigma B factor antagonist
MDILLLCHDGPWLNPADRRGDPIDRSSLLTESQSSSEANVGQLAIDLHVRDDTATLTVDGEVDLDTTGRLTSALAEAGSCGLVLVDLAGVTHMDSAGLRCLMTANADIERRGGRLRVSAASNIVNRLIEIAGVGSLLYENHTSE